MFPPNDWTDISRGGGGYFPKPTFLPGNGMATCKICETGGFLPPNPVAHDEESVKPQGGIDDEFLLQKDKTVRHVQRLEPG